MPLNSHDPVYGAPGGWFAVPLAISIYTCQRVVHKIFVSTHVTYRQRRVSAEVTEPAELCGSHSGW